MRVLVAENDVILADVLRQRLEAMQFAVDMIPGTSEAGTLITERSCDLALLDLALPIAAAVEGSEGPELGADEEKVRLARMLADDFDRVVGWQCAGQALPRLAEIFSREDVSREVVAPVMVEGGISSAFDGT